MSRTKKAQPAKPKVGAGPVKTTTPHPDVWRTALRLAKGDHSRIVVKTPTEVVVLNAPQ